MKVNCIVDYSITFIFVVWAFLTLLNHTSWSSYKAWLSNVDIASIIPSWNFFAPNAPTGDFQLMYRVKSRINQQTSNWHSLESQPRKMYNFIWNPKRRNRKSFFDICNALIEDWRDLNENKFDDKFIQSSIPYLAIVNMLSTHVPSQYKSSTHYQFCIGIINELKDESNIVFMSRWHRSC